MKNDIVYLNSGNEFQPASRADLTPPTLDLLPPFVFSVQCTERRGFFLRRIDDLDVPAKLYGKTNEQAERIMTTFESRDGTTGVLLTGEKGSGKSALGKRLAQLAQQRNMPVLVINSAFRGEAFNQFIANINQPCVLFFDEFEKTYDPSEQSELLTILDGIYKSKKLFLMTCNDSYRINSFMMNRPGRIYYKMVFAGLDKEFIAEYCADTLKNMDNLKGVMGVASHFTAFSFDMLKALVEEMNRYDETATQAMKYLNMEPDRWVADSFKVSMLKGGEPIKSQGMSESWISKAPITLREGYQFVAFGAKVVPFDEDSIPEGTEEKAAKQMQIDHDNAERARVDALLTDGCVAEDIVARLDKNKVVSSNHVTGIFELGTDIEDITIKFERQVAKQEEANYDLF